MYYAAAMAVAVLIFLRKRPRKGMRLRLGGRSTKAAGGRDVSPGIEGSIPPDNVTPIYAEGERPLNVVFNWNGETWDAYEVLGIPAGSSQERVEKAYQDSLARVDEKSRSLMTTAYEAIRGQSTVNKASGSS